MNNSKEPFEKIRSLLERKRLFEELFLSQGEIVCKGEEEGLFHFLPREIIENDEISGAIIAEGKVPNGDLQVIGNFHVGAEKYFFVGILKVKNLIATLNLNCDVYKLQRRATFRLGIKNLEDIYLTITEFLGKPQYIAVALADVSAGGARLFFKNSAPFENFKGTTENPGLIKGSRFRGVIRPPSGKNIDLFAEVKHIQDVVEEDGKVTYFGVEFYDTNPVLKNRLMALVMDLQRKMVNEDRLKMMKRS